MRTFPGAKRERETRGMGVILIAFEREAELSALDQLLSGRGHRVVRSGNGLAALDAARREPPHAIVSDIVLPRMDGFALCRKWKQDERLQAIPFLFYTRRHDDPKYERFALELGAERFLARSVPPETLCTALDELLANAAKANGNTGNTTPLPTLDETLIQRTVGLDKAQRAAEAEKVQRIAELESAQRKYGTELENAQRKHAAELESAQRKQTEAVDRAQQAARCRRSALSPRVRIESAADVDRGSRDRRFHRSQRRGARVVRLQPRGVPRTQERRARSGPRRRRRWADRASAQGRRSIAGLA